MNALLGLIRFDGGPVQRDDLDLMAHAMAPWGYEVGDPWLGEAAAIAGDAIPIAGGSVVVFATGRVDNRDELSAALHIQGTRTSIYSAELMAAAYERWGLDAPRRILGDWAFAAYHPGQRRLVLARDHYGQTGLYYRRDEGSITFASSLKALFALPHALRLNELRLAQHLVPWPADGAATLYEGIFRLPPAHVLTADPTTLATTEYWHPREVPDIRLQSDEAYVEQFVELFSQAVRARLPAASAVASTQSAGLDSSAVTGFAAAEQLARGQRLTALTSVPAYPEVAAEVPDALTDEWPLAALALRGRPNVEHLRIDGATISPLHAIARSHAIHDELEWGIANMPWILAMLETCQARGERVLLTGQVGNGTISWSGDEAIALGRLRAVDVLGAIRALRARRAGPGGTWSLALRRELAGPVRRRIAGERARRAQRARGVIGRLIDPGFARRLNLEGRMAAAGFDSTFARATPSERRLAILLAGIHTVGAHWAEKARAYDLDVLDPTADVRLLEFCFGVPNDQFVRGEQNRWLIRRALSGVVPDEVRLNRRRGLQGADIAARLRADSAAVTAALESITESEVVRYYMNVGGLRESWEAVRRSRSSAAVLEAMGFVRGLAIGLLLVRFEGTTPDIAPLRANALGFPT